MTILHSEMWDRKGGTAFHLAELEFLWRQVGSSVVFVMYQITFSIWVQSPVQSNYLPDYAYTDIVFKIHEGTYAFAN